MAEPSSTGRASPGRWTARATLSRTPQAPRADPRRSVHPRGPGDPGRRTVHPWDGRRSPRRGRSRSRDACTASSWSPARGQAQRQRLHRIVQRQGPEGAPHPERLRQPGRRPGEGGGLAGDRPRKGDDVGASEVRSIMALMLAARSTRKVQPWNGPGTSRVGMTGPMFRRPPSEAEAMPAQSFLR